MKALKDKLTLKTMKSKLIIAMCLVTLIPIVIIGVFVNTRVTAETERSFVKATASEMKQVDNAFNTFLESVYANCRTLTNHPVVKQADDTITSYADSDTESRVASRKNGGIEAEIYNVYENFAQSHPEFLYLYLGTKYGGYLQWPEGSVPAHYDLRERPVYKDAIQAPGEVRLGEPDYWEEDDSAYINICQTLENNAGEIIGVQGVSVSLNSLTEIIKKIRIGESGYVVLTAGDGTIIAHPKKPELNFKKIDQLGVKELNKLKEIDSGEYDIQLDGKPLLANVYTSPETGWKFIAFIEKAEFLKSAQQIRNLLIILALIFILIVTAISVLLSSRLTSNLNSVTALVDRAANFDLTTAENEQDLLKHKDETGMIARAVITMRDAWRDIINQLQDTSLNLASSAQEISASSEETSAASEQVTSAIEQLAAGASDQATSVEKMNQVINQMSAGVQQVAAGTEKVSKNSTSVAKMAQDGGTQVHNAITKIKAVQQVSGKMAEVVRSLGEASHQVGEIVDVIKDIANQTNLLALNAAIEAARAGDQGRGFAVVAEEVRKLAEQSAVSAEKIAALIANVQQETEQAVQVTDAGSTAINEGVAAVNVAGESFRKIIAEIEQVVEEIQAASEAAQQMAVGSQQTAQSAAEIASVTEEAAASTQEISASMEEHNAAIEAISNSAQSLARMGEDLQKISSKFRV